MNSTVWAKELSLPILINNGVTVVKTKNQEDGLKAITKLLYYLVDRKSVLFLSGGRSPKELYESLAQDETLVPGAVGLVDERYGEPMHEDSNEKMIQLTGLLPYFQKQNVPFYKVLQKDKGIQEDTTQYDETVRFLLSGFSKAIGLLGVGLDGHTAGIPARLDSAKLAYREKETVKDPSDVISYFLNFPGPQKERISLTFTGLSMLDVLLVVVFGKDKKKPLYEMFTKGSELEIPARFFLRPEIAPKTILITDQSIQ